MKKLDLDRTRVKLLAELRALATAPLMRGTLGTRHRVCGRSNCACATDESRRHPGLYLSVQLGGRTRSVHVRAEDEARVRRMLAGYERLWAIVNELTGCEIEGLKGAARGRKRARRGRVSQDAR